VVSLRAVKSRSKPAMTNSEYNINEADRGCQVPGPAEASSGTCYLVEEAIKLGAVLVPTPGLVSRHISSRFSSVDQAWADEWLDGEERKRSIRQKVPSRKVEFRGRVTLMKEDVAVKRWFTNRDKSRHACGLRGKITKLTRAARNRLLLQARNVDGIKGELTLTYPSKFPTDGPMVKRHLFAMLDVLTRRNISGMWFLEFQKRGAPHFWLFLTGIIDKDLVSKAWYRIVGSGDERHLRAGTRIGKIRKPYALAAYAAKYAAKWEQKIVPAGYRDVGRFWGRFGGLEVKEEVLVSAPIAKAAGIIRLVKGMYKARRRSYTRKRFRDNGQWSFVAWGVAAGLKARIGEVLRQEVYSDG
jgi:hypothetical protein